MFRPYLLLSVLLSGCGKIATPPPGAGAMRFLALGDSYTIGQSVDESERWPVQLAGELRRSGINIGEPEIIARTGWTTGDLLGAMDRADLHGPYDLVGLLIGVNNQFQGRSEEEYRGQFQVLLSRAVVLAGGRAGRVVVLSIPDWGVTPYAKEMNADSVQVGAAIDRFNAINRELSGKAGVVYVDITAVSRERRDLVAGDGLHPNGEMYGKWVELALPGAIQSLQLQR